jgi:hypothetical protein
MWNKIIKVLNFDSVILIFYILYLFEIWDITSKKSLHDTSKYNNFLN